MDKENCKKHRFPLNPMIHYISKITKANFRSTLAEEELFPGQEEILLVVMFSEGITASEIAKKMNTSLASISVSLKRLEKSGFIEKKSDEKDSRTKRIFVSKKGKNSMLKIRENFIAYEHKMLTGFSEEEKEDFKDYLDRLIYNIGGEKDFSSIRPYFLREEDCCGKK